MFRESFKSKRCLVPASAFFEWQIVPGQKPIHSGMPVILGQGDEDEWIDPATNADTVRRMCSRVRAIG